ncbi:MAG: hydrolase, partial [Alphaproteobacteria bacterium]
MSGPDASTEGERMLIGSDTSTLLIIDVQERLAPVMDDPRKVLRGCALLVHAATRLGIPVTITEQYPKGLGPTMFDVRDLAPEGSTLVKTAFSCAAEPTVMARLDGFAAAARPGVVVAGIEAHVCVLQTALGLKALGREVFVVTDACSSRHAESEAAAYRRMATVGVHLVTLEMVLFEWLGGREHPAFKEIHR